MAAVLKPSQLTWTGEEALKQEVMAIQLREEVERAKVQRPTTACLAALPPPFALPFTAVLLPLGSVQRRSGRTSASR